MDTDLTFRIEPTVFFVREGGGLKQVLNVVINNEGLAAEGKLKGTAANRAFSFELGEIASGESIRPIHLDEVTKPTSAQFTLTLGEKTCRTETTLQPQRHWQVYLTHHTHVDIGYINLQSRIMQQHAQYIREAIRLCEETADYPEDAKFRWTCEGTWTVEHFLEGASEKEEAVFIELVRQGRIEVTALYLNMTKLLSHEELIRWVYAAADLRRKYGIQISTAMNTDVAGFSWALPQVLGGMGVRYFSTAVNETRAFAPKVPRPFYWQGPDKSRVLVWNADRDMAYNEGHKLGLSQDYQTAFERLPEHLRKVEKEEYPYDMLMLRVQGLTIDNAPPGIAISEVARTWNEKWAYPRLIVSTPTPFFERMEEQYGSKFPSCSGDWTDWWADGHGSTAYETGLNRQTHSVLDSVEKWDALGSLVDQTQNPSKKADFKTAYRDMLLFNEHTWGSGDSIKNPYSRLARGQWHRKATFAYDASVAATELFDETLENLSKNIRTSEPNLLAVFNPVPFERTDVVRAILPEKMLQGKSGFRIVDVESGKELPHQHVEKTEIEQEIPTRNRNGRMRYQIDINAWRQFQDTSHFIVFTAREVPAFGYRLYRVVPDDHPPECDSPISFGEDWMENPWYRIQFDRATGGLLSVYDKELKRELVDGSGEYRLNQYIYERPIGGRKAIDDKKRKTRFNRSSPVSAKIVRGVQGPVMGSMIARTAGERCSEIQQEVFLYANTKKIEIVNTLNKEETLDAEAVYYAFPFDVPDFTVRCEVEGCAMEPEVQQIPGACRDWVAVQNWVDFSNSDFGVTWTADEAPLVQLSQINTGRWADKLELKHSAVFSWTMNNYWMTNFKASQGGRMRFRYALMSHPGGYDPVRATRFGWGANAGLQARVLEKNPAGRLPASSESFCRIDASNVVLSAFKQAEDDQGIVIRFREIAGKQTAFRMELPQLIMERAYLTNIVEENQQALAVEDQQIGLTVGAYGVATIRVMGTASA
ncbi:MAG: hypothetical protein B1H02_06090 [Candidatus Latescibacteria bacterium 4484_107]|nr:MAG: hypothetical protein B1H02_06090 [Candidatus Latescibacteria bacterium 4484_107]